MSEPRGEPIGLAILGSTGSIGRQALEVVEALGDRFRILGLAAGRASEGFAVQLATYPKARAWCAGGRSPAIADDRWAGGGLEELATLDGVELVLVATTGMAALPAVLAALHRGRRVALANKETLVTGGHLVAAALDQAVGGDPFGRLELLRPVDSEHSAIWQCLLGERLAEVRRLILTASGGPFRGRSADQLSAVTPSEALEHPTWRMGPKISIDSATLVNKGFEIIEAKWLYGVAYPRIAVVIHPQSVVHSLVELADGSFKAQLGQPDMRLPIQFALTYPERLPSISESGEPEAWGSLQFEALRRGAYPALDTVRAAAEAGGNRGVIINAADEVAVAAFLDGQIRFPAIWETIAAAVDRWASDTEPSLSDVVALDREVRDTLTAELGMARAG